MGDRSGLTRNDRTNGYDDARGYMRAKKSKLAQQNDQIREALRHRNSTMRTDLFKGISINVNGRTQPTADELKRLILLNGGEYHPYYRYQTTKFMIATNLSTARVKQLRPDDRIVKPEWITESIQAKCLLPYQDYQLFVEDSKEPTKNDMKQRQPQLQLQLKLQPLLKSQPHSQQQHLQNSQLQPQQSQQQPIKKRPTTMNDFVTRGTKPNQFATPKVREQKRSVANICGLIKLDEIINMLNEWVGCPEGITDEDTACVTKYFYDLMSEKDYHNKFYEIISSLQQRVIQHGERCWIDVYNELVRTLKNELKLGNEASQNLHQLINFIETVGEANNDQDKIQTTISPKQSSPEVVILND